MQKLHLFGLTILIFEAYHNSEDILTPHLIHLQLCPLKKRRRFVFQKRQYFLKVFLFNLFWMVHSLYCMAIASMTEIRFPLETTYFSTYLHAQTGSGPTLSNRRLENFFGLKQRIVTLNSHFHLTPML